MLYGGPKRSMVASMEKPDQRVGRVSDGETVFCLVYVLGMHLTPGSSRLLPRGMYSSLCSPSQYDLFSSRNISNAPECLPLFSCVGGIKRHKWAVERWKLIECQRGSCWCIHCGRWFRSKGELAVHRCCHPPSRLPLTAAKQQLCLPARRRTASDHAEFDLVCGFGSCFRRQQHPSRNRSFLQIVVSCP